MSRGSTGGAGTGPGSGSGSGSGSTNTGGGAGTGPKSTALAVAVQAAGLVALGLAVAVAALTPAPPVEPLQLRWRPATDVEQRAYETARLAEVLDGLRITDSAVRRSPGRYVDVAGPGQ